MVFAAIMPLYRFLVPGWATVIARSIESDYPGRYGGGFVWLMSYLLVLAAPVVFLLAPALKIEDEEVQWGFVGGGVLGVLGAIVWGIVSRVTA